ncbi:MAG: o-succinylbenzoate synthase [Bacteroidia bacterium]|nr:o-succinylbenzoate synthase [Bacteroidia bacterium]
MLKALIEKHTLVYKKPATTSRGSLNERNLWLLKVWNSERPQIIGIGECAVLPGLSVDDVPDYEDKLNLLVESINNGKKAEELDLDAFPSIMFGLETALLDLKIGGKRILFENFYSIGRQGIPINGLIWMASKEEMLNEIKLKIAANFKCIKIKIGSLDFDEECRLLESIRKENPVQKLELRVDANGAFDSLDALRKLKELKTFDLHSIEQPIKAGHQEMMQEICAKSPVPVALDEELIGKRPDVEADKLLKFIMPAFIIIKPGLVGGFTKSDKWVKAAQKQKIGWWATSALESNIGLNAIAQWVAGYNPIIPQGLGTGHLYTKNFKPYTRIENGFLWKDIAEEIEDLGAGQGEA